MGGPPKLKTVELPRQKYPEACVWQPTSNLLVLFKFFVEYTFIGIWVYAVFLLQQTCKGYVFSRANVPRRGFFGSRATEMKARDLARATLSTDTDSHNALYWQVPVSGSIFGFFVPGKEASISPAITPSPRQQWETSQSP